MKEIVLVSLFNGASIAQLALEKDGFKAVRVDIFIREVK